VAQEPDELSLEESDVVNVLRVISDGRIASSPTAERINYVYLFERKLCKSFM